MVNNIVYHLLVLLLGWDNFEKKKTAEKDPLKKSIEAPLYTLYWGFKKILCKACLFFNCFLVIKIILKALFSFIPSLLDFSDFPSYGSNLRKRYTLWLLSMFFKKISTIRPVFLEYVSISYWCQEFRLNFSFSIVLLAKSWKWKKHL